VLCSCSQPHHQWLTLVLPTIISVSALVLVAWGQLKRDKQRLRLELYDRRFAIFEKTVVFYRALEGSTESDEFKSRHRGFIDACDESRFLFKPSSGIFEMLDELRKNCLARKPRADNSTPESVATYWKWLDRQLSQLRDKLGPYLNFQKALS
jgi:hypothetical protein